MRTPNLNALRMFDAAARRLNFRLAAEEQNLTQGAVAQQVRRLEADLGFQLFHRKARGLVLTDVGRNYHGAIRRALGIIDEATRKLVPESAKVTLSVTPSFASKWLVPRLGDFARAHPDIAIQTIASEGLADFKSDGVDLAIRLGRSAPIKGLHMEWLAPLQLRAVCSPDYAARIDPIKGLEDLTVQSLIQDGHDLWDNLFDEVGLETRGRVLKFNQTALAMDAAANGQGVALVPGLLLTAELDRGRLVELWQDTRPQQNGYYLIYPENGKVVPAREQLIVWIKSELKAG